MLELELMAAMLVPLGMPAPLTAMPTMSELVLARPVTDLLDAMVDPVSVTALEAVGNGKISGV